MIRPHFPVAILVFTLTQLSLGCDVPRTCEGVECVLGIPIDAPTLPNDVALSSCNGEAVALIASSGESRLDAVTFPDGAVVASTTFETGASPWAVAVNDTGTRAVVTLFGSDEVALVEPCQGTLLDTATIDGAVTPEPVILRANTAFVAFTNVLQLSVDGEPPILDPGVIAMFDIADDVLFEVGRTTLECENPQGLALFGADVVASCSGPLARGADGGQEALEDGALVILDGTTLEPTHTIGAARNAPGTPVVIGSRVIVGSLVSPVILSADLEDTALATALTLEGPNVEAIFEVTRWNDNLVLATQFSADAIRVLRLDGATVTLSSTIPVGPGGTAFRGLQAIDVKPDFSEVDGLALLGLSAQVVPLALHRVLP